LTRQQRGRFGVFIPFRAYIAYNPASSFRSAATVISNSPEHSDLIAFVHRWFRLLSDGRDDDAAAQLDEPNEDGQQWSGQAIRHAIDEAFPEGCRFRVQHGGSLRVTDPKSASGSSQETVVELADRDGYSVWCSVPLNGEWSDLSALFTFVRRDDGLAVVLDELHVL
jgi:hypothetical protein